VARKKFYVILDIITNVLIVPVLLLSLVASIVMYNAKKHNEVPSLFGYSAVKILTTSMQTEETPEYSAGNVVLVKKVSPELLDAGDVIAFYEYVRHSDEDLDFDDVAGGTIVSGTVGNGSSEAAKAGSRVIFHRIVEIKQAYTEDGELHYFYLTKGDANPSVDTYIDSNGKTQPAYIRDDFVVGEYTDGASFLIGFLTFCSSAGGIVALVIVPAGVLLLMVTLSIIEQINSILLDKKMNRRKLIEAEKLMQGEVSGTASNMNLNSNTSIKEANKETIVKEKKTSEKSGDAKTESKAATPKTPPPVPPKSFAPPPAPKAPPKPPAKPKA